MRSPRVVTLSVGVLLLVSLWSWNYKLPSAFPISTSRIASVAAEAAATGLPDPSAGAEPSAGAREASPSSLAALDFKNGFRDLKFGEPPTHSMVLKDDAGDKKYYTRPEDDLSIGGGRANQLIYGFTNNRLSTILIQTNGMSNSRALLEVLRQAYGPGSQPDPSLPRYTWRGSQVRVSYNENANTHNADTWLHHVPARDEEQKDAEKADLKTTPQRPSRAWRWGPMDLREGRP